MKILIKTLSAMALALIAFVIITGASVLMLIVAAYLTCLLFSGEATPLSALVFFFIFGAEIVSVSIAIAWLEGSSW